MQTEGYFQFFELPDFFPQQSANDRLSLAYHCPRIAGGNSPESPDIKLI